MHGRYDTFRSAVGGMILEANHRSLRRDIYDCARLGIVDEAFGDILIKFRS